MDKEYVKGVVADIVNGKKLQRVVPNYALMENIKENILNDLIDTLREMCREHILDWHGTVNSVAFTVNEEKEEV